MRQADSWGGKGGRDGRTPVGKPQAGRHTTAAAYLPSVGLERLSAPFIGTRFLQKKANKQTNERCCLRRSRGRGGGGGAAKSKMSGDEASRSHAETRTFNQALPVFSAACNILAIPPRPLSAVQRKDGEPTHSCAL